MIKTYTLPGDTVSWEEIPQSTVSRSKKSFADAERELIKWAVANPTEGEPGNNGIVIAYSQGTQRVLYTLRNNPTNPDLTGHMYVLIASPETPGNGNGLTGSDKKSGLPPEFVSTDGGQVVFVVNQYDVAADRVDDRSNFYAVLNEWMSLSRHLDYEEVDLSSADATYFDPETGSISYYYRADVLPMLKWRDWFTSDEKMAELDAKYRPLVEAGHDRPGTVTEQLNSPSLSINSAKIVQDEIETWNSTSKETQMIKDNFGTNFNDQKSKDSEEIGSEPTLLKGGEDSESQDSKLDGSKNEDDIKDDLKQEIKDEEKKEASEPDTKESQESKETKSTDNESTASNESNNDSE